MGQFTVVAADVLSETQQVSAPSNYSLGPDLMPTTGPDDPAPAGVAPAENGLDYQLPAFWFSALGRGYYSNDQRIEFTGQESTFGVEGILAGSVARECLGWTAGLTAELYLNQPFDRNILVDNPVRRSFRGNFEIDPLEISQLYVSLRQGDALFALGKMVTPFGRTYFPLYKNDRSDAPFIRTESILWRETGLLLQYEPGSFVFTAALVNGGLDLDTNSSKGGISRVGLRGESFAAGISAKYQDGIGSEGQKEYNRHLGVDAMFLRGPWILSTEAIYDEYGFRRPFDPLDITWQRSIYNRDLFLAPGRPLQGLGYYADVGYHGEAWLAMLNYGEFYPRPVGDAIHDRVTRRGIVKLIRHWNDNLDSYGMVMVENDMPTNQIGRRSSGVNVLFGLQFAL